MSGAHYELYTKHGPAERDWMRNAACRIDGTPDQIRKHADSFFPHPNDKAGRHAAQAICNRCPVKTECRGQAETLDIPFGVWGGRHMDAPKAHGPKPRCGTERGYYRHLDYGEPVDDECLEAAQHAWDRRKQNRKKGQHTDV
ncbi:WhiB family transcriptional regulator [Mycobacterium sp. C3-094]